MAEITGLLNRQSLTGLASSNLAASAMKMKPKKVRIVRAWGRKFRLREWTKQEVLNDRPKTAYKFAV